MKSIEILRGVSGSGKSTYCHTWQTINDLVVSADDFFGHGEDYKKNFSPALLGAALAACFKACIEGVLNPAIHRIFVDNTNTTAVEIAPYIALASAYEIPYEIVEFRVDHRVAVERNVHGVGWETINAQYRRLCQEHLPPFWKRPIACR